MYLSLKKSKKKVHSQALQPVQELDILLLKGCGPEELRFKISLECIVPWVSVFFRVKVGVHSSKGVRSLIPESGCGV